MLGEVEKGEVWIGERWVWREGRRKVGGVCSALLDWSSLRTAGRMAVGVDIVGGVSSMAF